MGEASEIVVSNRERVTRRNRLGFRRVGQTRGERTAFTAKIPPRMANRLVDGARGVLNNFLPDVYIFTDHHNGKEGGNSPAYGISLVAETTEGYVFRERL